MRLLDRKTLMDMPGIMVTEMPATSLTSVRVERSRDTHRALPEFLDCAPDERAFAPDAPLNHAPPHSFPPRP
ncbi:hypothetical protein EP837_00493 [Sphingobium sp. EP60837]|nr:hypothetical protein EP837_00493 [Sphingobium sp. EP60837]